jgi:hypothetical protein
MGDRNTRASESDSPNVSSGQKTRKKTPTLTLGNHCFSVKGLHPEAQKLMEFLIEALTQEATEPHAKGFDAQHMGIVADYLGQYAALQRLLKSMSGKTGRSP